jgi:hypothetical protein
MRKFVAWSLDVINVINSLPWNRIGEGLNYHRVFAYLRDIVRAYLRDRGIVCAGSGGRIIRRAVRRGAPLGSVLGPLLWVLAYDAVLLAPMAPSPRSASRR